MTFPSLRSFPGLESPPKTHMQRTNDLRVVECRRLLGRLKIDIDADLPGRHGDGPGLLAGRAAGRPDLDPSVGPRLGQGRQQFGLEDAERGAAHFATPALLLCSN